MSVPSPYAHKNVQTIDLQYKLWRYCSGYTMKTLYHAGSFLAALHKDRQDDEEARERMLEYRLANRDDAREIHVVIVPVHDSLNGPKARTVIDNVSKTSNSDLAWAMHWAVQVGDQYFELQRDHYDPTRTGLRMSKWNERQKSQILQRYFQGFTAMNDDEIKAVGDSRFSRLNKMHINKYDVWCNNCHVTVLHMLRDIGGLSHYWSQLTSLHEWIRGFFCNSILAITKAYYRHRGCDQDVIVRHQELLLNTLRILTSRSIHYPKRQWIREDIAEAETVVKKMGTMKEHWFLTVLESSLSLRKGAETSYIRRGADGKPELNFDAVREAVKGIFDEGEGNAGHAWLKAIPWLTAGFLVGTPRWAFAVMSIALQQVTQHFESSSAAKTGLELSLEGMGLSPKLQDSQYVATNVRKTWKKDMANNARTKRRMQVKDSKLVMRYEQGLSAMGIPYYIDHKNNQKMWEAPEWQELCIKISNPPLSKRWQEKQNDDHLVYVNLLTETIVDKRPGLSEIWAVKKRIAPSWVKSTIMALPHGWQLQRTDQGELFYLNHNDDPPSSTNHHPMRRAIESERQSLLPEWNVEWDNDRGKKYRNLQTGEIRWKVVDGPKQTLDPTGNTSRKPRQEFAEPLPVGWNYTIDNRGQKIYTSVDGLERSTHPLSDQRRILLPDWEMRYTAAGRKYWVHHGHDGRGSAWWTRNQVLKNWTLKNNASGWKLSPNQVDWEWFEAGDVPHKEIPVLDLDDSAEFELREFPFLLPDRIMEADGSFIEPLPPHWVRRKRETGEIYFWNFVDEIKSDEHPIDRERANLPALWEMRYTRHGRQYFIHHETGSSWWTHPREDKNKLVLRANAGQKQDGWRRAEGGRSWERFAEYPNEKLELQSVKSLSTADPNAIDGLNADEEDSNGWRSLNFTKEWLKSVKSVSSNVSSNEAVANALTQVQSQAKELIESGKVPKTPQWMVNKAKGILAQKSNATPISATPPTPLEDLPSTTTPKKSSLQTMSSRSWGRTTSNVLKLKGGKSSKDSSDMIIMPDQKDSINLPSESPWKDGLGLSYFGTPDSTAVPYSAASEIAVEVPTDHSSEGQEQQHSARSEKVTNPPSGNIDASKGCSPQSDCRK